MAAVQRIVILGGGVAGWMSAATLSRALAGSGVGIDLVEIGGEDHSLGPFGPAETSLPAFHTFLGANALDEDALLRAAGGCFSLGAAFSGWGGEGSSWFLPFGDVGAPMGAVAFPHLITRIRAAGHAMRIADFSLAAVAAASGRFARPSDDPRSVLSSYGYGLQFEKRGLAAFLQASARDVAQHRANFRRAIRGEDGLVTALELDSGETVPGDLFLDCSGPTALLCGETPFESWSQWLRCDRVVERWVAEPGVPPPYGHAGAHAAGWRRTVPLPGGQSEALIYASSDIDDEEATGAGTPVVLAQGRRAQAWTGNVIAIGAAATLIEPLHGYTLQLVHNALQRLIALFPADVRGAGAAEYNRLTASEADRVRDFAILHYKANARTGEPFWDACRDMAVPETLQHKLDLYRSRGRVPIYDDEMFDRPEWSAAMDGMGLHPRRYDALADTIAEPELFRHVARVREMIVQAVQSMPGHGAPLRQIGVLR